jgi:DNA adenine methylase
MNYSPLRYPGGKSRITPIVKKIINNCKTTISTYIEPFAGGAGVALNLLFDRVIECVIINDYDKAIYSFWRAILTDTENFINKIKTTSVSVAEWKRQRKIYLSSNKYSLEFAFSVFYLNRTNRSGIISAGPIGGYLQQGEWTINARYNIDKCIDRILKISKYKNRIRIFNMDIRKFILKHHGYFTDNSFVYFDPPYINNSKRLYKNSLDLNDHCEISQYIHDFILSDWIITYDDVDIIHALYKKHSIIHYNINYSVAQKRKALELLILKNEYLLEGIWK